MPRTLIQTIQQGAVITCSLLSPIARAKLLGKLVNTDAVDLPFARGFIQVVGTVVFAESH